MLLAKSSFEKFQAIFYRKVAASPYSITLSIITPTTVQGSMEEFVGDSDRDVKQYEFPCLYEKTVDVMQREKYGLPDMIDGIVFLSPLQLVPVLGTYLINKERTKITFEGRTHVIDRVIYLESLFNSCVSVQLDIKDDLKGG